MSNSAMRLTLRQKPHLDFVIGYPGLIPDGNTPQASLQGTVEVRVQNPVFTQWLKVELKKTEIVQTSKGIRKYFELIGSQEQRLWNGADQASADADKFSPLDTSDHSFEIPIPPGLPPSIILDKSKNTGIVYHLVATAMIKVKSKGLFSSGNSFKPPSLVTQMSEVTIEKHELNPSWPVYAWQAENAPLQIKQANLSMQLKRETVIFGGNDQMRLDIDIKSERNAPIKITRIELLVKELITTREADVPGRGGTVDPRKTLTNSYDILSLKCPCHNILYQNETMSHALLAVFPVHHPHFTVQNAKHLDVKYVMRLRAVLEVPKEAKLKKGEVREKDQPLKEIVLDNVAVIVSPWSKKQAEWWRTKIGKIPQNLRRPEAPSSAGAVPGPSSAPTQPVLDPVPEEMTSEAHPLPPRMHGAPAYPPGASPSLTPYGQSSAAAASRAFNQRVQKGNQLYSSQSGQSSNQNLAASSSQPLQPVQASQPAQASQPVPAPIQSQPLAATRSKEEQRAIAIEQGKRLSSWPPPPRDNPAAPTIAVTAPSETTTTTGNRYALQASMPLPGQNASQPMHHRQTKSESGHGSVYWQPPREVASLDGHTATISNSPPPKPYQMNGAYPLAKSQSLSQDMSTMGYANPWSPPTFANHRRVFSDANQQTRQSSPPGTDQPSSPVRDRRLSTPVLSSSIPINAKDNHGSNGAKRRIHVETTQGGFPTRKNTLSTIVGSETSSQQSSPVHETQTVPMPEADWESAEAEKERLYNEATDRARRTQERAGHTHTLSDGEYRSIQDRTPTPLSLVRSMSNPQPSPARHENMQTLRAPTPLQSKRLSIASTHLDYLNDYSEHANSLRDRHTPSPRTNGTDEHQCGDYQPDHTEASEPRRNSSRYESRRHSTGPSSYSDHAPTQKAPPPPPQAHSGQDENCLSPTSPSTSWSGFSKLDPQKMAYLRALAAREAYQQRMLGVQPEPLTALEEKQRLQRMYEEEEQRAGRGEDAWQTLPEVPPAIQARDRYSETHEASTHAQNADLSYDSQRDKEAEYTPPQSSVYLTPDTTQGKWQEHNNTSNFNGFHNPYFESPNASSTHIASDGSSLSHNYRRNSAVAKGKQRRRSTYRSENGNSYESLIDGLASPPARPPKSRDVLQDTYRHYDTPVSPSAEEYERKLLWGRSQSSHHGHY